MIVKERMLGTSASEAEKMPTESTPLIQTVRVGPPRRRYPHQTCRRFFTIASACVLIGGFVTFAVYALVLEPQHFPHGRHSHHSVSQHKGKKLSHEDLRAILLETPSTERIEDWSRYYTAGPHLAGQNLSQAEWTRDKWESWGVSSSIVAYDTYLNYPNDHSLSVLKKSKDADTWSVSFEASLTEDVLDEDPSSGLDNRVPTFHGYSASGNVTGRFVFVNYGTYADYKDLIDAGVELEGKIAIARYFGVFRGLKVKRAQELGMIGVVIYTDPGDDGEITDENGYKMYPDGPARHPSSVQRGSVQFLSTRPGDPTTPGYPSKPDSPRAPGDDSIPAIPSIPISYADAVPILKTLNGHGPKIGDFNKYWNRNLGLKYKGVDYNIGPSPEDLVLNLYNKQDYVTTPQWDVIGIVNGSVANEVVVVGNHRDAWIAGGAGDPNSGSASMNEVIRSVGKAVEAGWKPFRTIVFASWDGEEYGLIGSTEWVEEYLPWIQDANVAYINVDVAASGTRFSTDAAPLLNQIVRDAVYNVQSPNQTVEGQSVGDLWDDRIGTMGSGSDFTAFQDFAGVPCINVGFSAGPGDPVYQYHSNYDSFHWMTEFGDPGFKYHLAMAQIIGLMLAELADNIVIPFGAVEYVEALEEYVGKVEAKLEGTVSIDDVLVTDDHISAFRAIATSDDVKGNADAFKEKLADMRKALVRLSTQATLVDMEAEWAREELEADIPWWNVWRKVKLGMTIHKVNRKYKFMERQFLFEGGLDNRDWFKHVVFAPGLWTGYAGAVFPGLMESIDSKDYVNGLKWAGIIENCINKATASLR